MIIGAHSIIYSTNPEADRKFLKDVLQLSNVDVGGGWLIFGLPPSEVAVHPSEKNNIHEFYLMCEDIEALFDKLADAGVEVSREISEERWGRLASIPLPSGARLPVYQPLHPVAYNLQE